MAANPKVTSALTAAYFAEIFAILIPFLRLRLIGAPQTTETTTENTNNQIALEGYSISSGFILDNFHSGIIEMWLLNEDRVKKAIYHIWLNHCLGLRSETSILTIVFGIEKGPAHIHLWNSNASALFSSMRPSS